MACLQQSGAGLGGKGSSSCGVQRRSSPRTSPLLGESIVSLLVTGVVGVGGRGRRHQQVERVKSLDCVLGWGFVLTEQGHSLEKGRESHSWV